MGLLDKLTILADAAKYDAARTSSGLDQAGRPGGLGSILAAGRCHSFSADGRCISLLEVLLTNRCVYDCAYCVNHHSSGVHRTAFTPRELAELIVGFYRRNYIEELLPSSAVWGGPDRTAEAMIEVLCLLREEYSFRGYIHAKVIPGADPLLTRRLGLPADRLSVNIELPSEENLGRLAPDEAKAVILAPMAQIRDGTQASRGELARFRHALRFALAGQSTQMVIDATPESGKHILTLTQALYDKYKLRRAFYSAYMPVSDSALLPARWDFKPPLLRKHRLYQANWLLRFYHFRTEELLDGAHSNFNPLVDPKCSWALGHPEFFPVEVNRADYEALLWVPGIGVTSARRILVARRCAPLTFAGLKKLGVVLKRAQYFLICGDKYLEGLRISPDGVPRHLVAQERPMLAQGAPERLSLFEQTGQEAAMDWTPVSYAYDGSLIGFLTCVFASYTHREKPMSFSIPEDGRIFLWPERTVDTDETRVQRVYRSLALRLGQEGRRLAVYGFLTCLEEREFHLRQFLRLGYDRGLWVVRDLTDDRMAVLTRAVGHLTEGAHLLKGFTHFSGQEGVLVGEIAPKNRVLPLLRPHFCARYPEESFVLYDRTHREALFYRLRRQAIIPLETFRAAAPGREERDFRRLWRRSYDTIAIEGRENPRCRMTQMPKRFWGTMTELQNEPEERKELAP